MADQFKTEVKGTDGKKIPVTMERLGSFIGVQPEGYGDANSQDCEGTPIILEVWEGALRLIIWSDINSQDPTHIIDLENAREDKRKDESGN